MGIMVADYFIVRKQRIKLTELYKPHGNYRFLYGVNLRALPAWIIGWVPTVGGLSLTASGKKDGPAALYQLYYLAFFYGKL
jgi:nucleobase:cation symporter-1, NCS1 family